jgi:hypothetical protein
MQLKISQIKGNSEAPEYWASKNPEGRGGKGTKTKAKQNSKNWTPQSTSFFKKTIWSLLQEAFIHSHNY